MAEPNELGAADAGSVTPARQTFVVAENARRSRESPSATALYLDPVNPIYWTQYPFITDALGSFDDFLAALSARFGDSEWAGAGDDSPYTSGSARGRSGSGTGTGTRRSASTLSIRLHHAALS